jgi:hypothetical protein
MQVYIRKDALSERDFSIFKLLDFGDFVGKSASSCRDAPSVSRASAMRQAGGCAGAISSCFQPMSDVRWSHTSALLNNAA